MRRTVGILGTPVDRLNRQETLARLQQFIEQGSFHQVATANTDFVVNALTDPELSRILKEAALVTPDGMPVVWAARVLFATLPERVTGADIVPELAQLAAHKGYRIYLLGARQEVACRAQARLEADYPGIRIVGCVSPPEVPLAEMDSEALLQDIARVHPDILLVAFGNPKQEKWIYRHREQLQQVPVCIGVGGTFDFLAGEAKRAPLWMQRRGLEWLYRLLQDPARLWRRYNRDFRLFGLHLARQAWAMRRCPPHADGTLQSEPTATCTTLHLSGTFGGTLLPQVQQEAEAAFQADKNLLLDLERVTALDGEALGLLLRLPLQSAHSGRAYEMINLSIPIARLLQAARIDIPPSQANRSNAMPDIQTSPPVPVSSSGSQPHNALP